MPQLWASPLHRRLSSVVMTDHSASNARHEAQHGKCQLCRKPLPFHDPFCLSLVASFREKAAQILTADSRELGHAIQTHQHRADGSSSTPRGATASRSWSKTGSSATACRRLRQKRYANTSPRPRSVDGTGSIKISGSSKSISAVAPTIGVWLGVVVKRFGKEE